MNAFETPSSCVHNYCLSKFYLVILFFTFTLIRSTTSELQGNEEHSFREEFILSQHDHWCKLNCFSVKSCDQKFRDNFVDFQVQTNHSILDGPGQHLIYDSTYLGRTISKQTFETQFVLDISEISLGISPCKVYVMDTVSVGRDYKNLLIKFRIYEVLHGEIYSLTRQIQNHSSLYYSGKVTSATNQLVGLVIPDWDFSLRLAYAIKLVGGNETKTIDNELVLNQGSYNWCDHSFNLSSFYCEFEHLFEDDLHKALSLPTRSDVFEGENVIQVLFVKPSGLDSVIITCRFMPPFHVEKSVWLDKYFKTLIQMIHDQDSVLFQGNVTFRIDPTWGISQKSIKNRESSKRLNRSVQNTPQDTYTRCKDTHRCGRGWSHYNETSSESKFTRQLYPGGKHEEIFLFADFEDWRQGTKGWEKNCVEVNLTHSLCGENYMKKNENAMKPEGAHFSPFDFPSLGPSIPSFNTSYNNGLVLNAAHLREQVRKQKAWISELEEYILWIRNEMNITSLEANTRFRKDIRSELSKTLGDYENLLSREMHKLQVLANSQCANVNTKDCYLQFNTSNLELTGIINATGSIGLTPDGTEVAVWAFDSIDIGEEVALHLTGQRAFAILSKSSIRIDTNLTVRSGTLGGFPGGFSIARYNRVESVCPKSNKRSVPPYTCRGDYPLSKIHHDTISNNINGPGSASVRVYSFTIKTSAVVVHEVKSIVIDANKGQVLSGGFILHFNGYSTPLINYDVTAKKMKSVLEDSLNAAKLNILSTIDRNDVVPGIGRVSVSRSSYGTSGGSEWRITFKTAIGDIGVDSTPLTVTNLLNGIGASVEIETLVNGNSLGGTFRLRFLNNITRPLEHDITAINLRDALIQDIPLLVNVSATRTGYHAEKCYDGFCTNGPHQTGGYTWSLILTTHFKNLSPSSPTSTLFDQELSHENIHIHNNLTGCVLSICPNITVVRGHEMFTKEDRMTRPFSLSYGGGGAGFGSFGGEGIRSNSRGKPYGDLKLTNLHGGSGGSLGFEGPFDVLMVGIPSRVRGGSGGGAVEIVAMNDISIGPNSFISCNGEKGWRGLNSGGGGGSGGSILISANGNVNIEGTIKAQGGDGSTPLYKGEVSSNGGGGGSGGRFAAYGKTISSLKVDVSGGICDRHNKNQCFGKNGTIYKKEKFSHSAFINITDGALGTNHSLHLKSSQNKEMQFWMDPRNQYQAEGPEYVFRNPGKPGRVSLHVKFDCSGNLPDADWGFSIGLKDKMSSQNPNKTMFLAIGESLEHWFGTTQSLNEINIHQYTNKTNFITEFNRWYHVDIRLNWDALQYNIFVDGYLLVSRGQLEISSMYSFSMYLLLSNVDVLVDEIYIGKDDSMDFLCPLMLADSKIEVNSINEYRGWKTSEMGGINTYKTMTRHESHLSKRDLYIRSDNGGILPFDGENLISFQTEVKSRSEQSVSNHLKFGSLLFVEKSEVNIDEQTTYFWYKEHYNEGFDGSDNNLNEHFGGVGACSTTDFKVWKNEGIMLHYANLTDMVMGSSGPFHIERPVVLYNEATKKFVMWMIIDNKNRSLAMAGVATSAFANGPFTFVRSFYPDGNATRDQTIHKTDDGFVYLIRTYTATVDYTIPSAIMQPIWESVKRADGTTNFPLSYHRAQYEPGYDDYHDIYLQRWRGEDTPWKIVCINRRTKVEREISYGREGIDICDNESEYKKVIGQGSPLYESSKDGVKSRFLDPNNDENNIWKPSSVPKVKAQSWKANYNDDSCGKYLIGDDLDQYDPTLPQHKSKNRRDCSNIVDNPIHPTLPDKRIGPQETIYQRRAKYVAVSRLTDDYLDTTGEIMSFEGELENNADLSSIVASFKNELLKGQVIGEGSTYLKKVHLGEEQQETDWRRVLHQYEYKENDRSFYSLACVIDGICPVNFKIQEEN